MSRRRTTAQKTGLGDRLKKLREARGLTQPELAHKLRLAPGTVSRWEREVGSPQAEQLLALSEFFDTTLDYLLLGESTPTHTAVHSPELHMFLTTTAAGRYARENKLVPLLLQVPLPASVDFYRQLTIAIRTLLEEAAEDASAKTDQIKKPTR